MDVLTVRAIVQFALLALTGICVWLFVDLMYRQKVAQLWAQWDAMRTEARTTHQRDLFRAWDETAQVRRELAQVRAQAQVDATAAQLTIAGLRLELASMAWAGAGFDADGAGGADDAQVAQGASNGGAQ